MYTRWGLCNVNYNTNYESKDKVRANQITKQILNHPVQRRFDKVTCASGICLIDTKVACIFYFQALVNKLQDSGFE